MSKYLPKTFTKIGLRFLGQSALEVYFIIKTGLETKLPLTLVFLKDFTFLTFCVYKFWSLGASVRHTGFLVYWYRARALFQKVQLQNIFSSWGIASHFIILTSLGYTATLLELAGLMGCCEDANQCVSHLPCDCDKWKE